MRKCWQISLVADICIMYILIVAATAGEIAPTVAFIKQHGFSVKEHETDVLITGVGAIATTYQLTSILQQSRPDYVLQAGIAGSFSNDLPLGSIVFVGEEMTGDCGAWENNGFSDLFDLKLLNENDPPFTNKGLPNPYTADWAHYQIPFVRSISVNESTTQPARIELLKKKYNPATESMEGAAFHYVCLSEQIPFMQIRAISNLVGERNKGLWKMEEAIANLNTKLIELISALPEL